MHYHLAVLPGLALLSAYVMPPPSPAAAQPPHAMTPAAWTLAEEQADRFDRAFGSGRMSGVAGDIENCYARAMASGEQVPVRRCLVYDDFADRFAAHMARQAHFPIPPFFQPASVYPRLTRYSSPAGFTDPQIMSGYLTHGSNAIFAVIASRARQQTVRP